jgi:hypothetical protein
MFTLFPHMKRVVILLFILILLAPFIQAQSQLKSEISTLTNQLLSTSDSDSRLAIAKERKEKIIQLVENFPQDAYIPLLTLEQASQFPKEVRDHLEQHVVENGNLEIFSIISYGPDLDIYEEISEYKETINYNLITEYGTEDKDDVFSTLIFNFNDVSQSIPEVSKDSYSVNGKKISNIIFIESIQKLDTIVGGTSIKTGNQEMAVIMVGLKDEPLVFPHTREFIIHRYPDTPLEEILYTDSMTITRNDMVGVFYEIGQEFSKYSYDNINFDIDVFGPYQLDINPEECGIGMIKRKGLKAAQNEMSASGKNYNFVHFVFNGCIKRDRSGWGEYGGKYRGRRVESYSTFLAYGPCNPPKIIFEGTTFEKDKCRRGKTLAMHEIGHNLEARHASSGTYSENDRSIKFNYEYGDFFDIMGIVLNDEYEYNPIIKKGFNWFNNNDELEVQNSGTYIISEYSKDSSPKYIKYTKNSRRIFISYRKDPLTRSGVLLLHNSWADGGSESVIIKNYLVQENRGEYFSEEGLLFEFLRANNNELELKITIDPTQDEIDKIIAINEGFIRGDANNDGRIDVSDAIFILNWLFLSGDNPLCLDALDVDDSGTIDISDSIYLLNTLFQGDRLPPSPYPVPGIDPTQDSLNCRSS